MQQNFRENIEAIRGKTTVLISSHDLRELQALCDHVCMIEAGRLVRQGPLDRILGEVSKVTVRVGALGDRTAALTAALVGYDRTFAEGTMTVHFDPRKIDVPAVNRAVLSVLLAHGVDILGLDAQKTLEESYLETVKRD
jgi:ABC-2 type transport system ATP-binding protein